MQLEMLRLLTLDLTSPARQIDQRRIDSLKQSDWGQILRITRRHRIAPLLHWQLLNTHSHLLIPPDVKAALAKEFELSVLASLASQRALLRVHDLLQDATIPYAALKGPYLAWHIYPHPALRPMRDLDILVPATYMMAARDALMKGGLTTAGAQPLTEALPDHDSPHLPPLRAGSVQVELHRRALHFKRYKPTTDDLTARPAFWERRVSFQLMGRSIMAPSPCDQAAHLIIHAVWDHVFSNGPLLLSDLAFASRSGLIDWASLAARMEELGATRPAQLAIALCRRYWGEPCSLMPSSLTLAAADVHIEQIAALQILRDTDSDGEAALIHDLRRERSFSYRARRLLSAALPSRASMAAMYPEAADSSAVLACYPLRWYRLATRRIASALRPRTTAEYATDLDQLVALHDWLSRDRYEAGVTR